MAKDVRSCLLLLVAATLFTANAFSSARPDTWAAPIALAGVPNLHKVSEGLYRGAQPTAEGMRGLAQLGVKTVVNLRSAHADDALAAGLPLAIEAIPMVAWRPRRADAVRFLRVVGDPARTPLLVHCHYGADRTGALVALYRIAVQGWSKDEAIREMTEGGFGFHSQWANLPRWVRSLDVDQLRRDAGLSEPLTPAAAPGPAS